MYFFSTTTVGDQRPSTMANYGQGLVLWSAVVNHTGLPSLTLNSTWEQKCFPDTWLQKTLGQKTVHLLVVLLQLSGSFVERDSDLTGNKLRSPEQIILSLGVLCLVNRRKHLYQNTTWHYWPFTNHWSATKPHMTCSKFSISHLTFSDTLLDPSKKRKDWCCNNLLWSCGNEHSPQR